MQIQVCVICKVKRPPLFSLSCEYRQILEAIISSAVDTTILKQCRLVACLDCQRLIKTVLVFRQTALVGVRNLLSLLPVVEPTPPEPDPLEVPIKNEPEEELTETKPSFVTDESETLKTFPEIKTEDNDSSATESCESDAEEHIAVHGVKKEVPVEQTAEATQVAVDKPRQNMEVPFVDQRLVPISSHRRGATLVGSGIVTVGRGPVTPERGIITNGRGAVTAGRGIVTVGRGPVTPERGIITVGRGAVTVERGAFAVGRGTVTAERGTVTVGRGTVTVERGAFAVRRATVSVGRGVETIGRGTGAVERGIITVGRGPLTAGRGTVTFGRGTIVLEGAVTAGRGTVPVGRETDTVREGAVTAWRGKVTVGRGATTVKRGALTVGRGAATAGRGAPTVRRGTANVRRGAATVGRGGKKNQVKKAAKRPSSQTIPYGSKRAKTTDKPPDTQAAQPDSNPWYIYVLQDHEVTAEREALRNSKEYTEAEFRCELCLRTFASVAEVETHAKLHLDSAGLFECLVCTQRMATTDELSLHRSKHSVRYRCCDCSYTTPDKEMIMIHTCDPEELQTIALSRRRKRKRYHCPYPKPVKCNKCASRYKDEAALARHVTRMHSEPEEPTDCKECGKTFKNKFMMKKHSYSHMYNYKGLDNLRPELFCAECKIPFGSIYAYRIHLQSLKHSSKDHRKVECDYCGKKFVNKFSVNLHIKLMHTQEREFKCSECPKAYVSRVRLQRHAQTHLPDTRPRPHVCECCGKAFLHKPSLEQHMNTHYGLRPYKCKLCPATFSFSGAVYTHTKLKHLKMKQVWKKKPSKKKLETKEESLDSEKS